MCLSIGLVSATADSPKMHALVELLYNAAVTPDYLNGAFVFWFVI